MRSESRLLGTATRTVIRTHRYMPLSSQYTNVRLYLGFVKESYAPAPVKQIRS